MTIFSPHQALCVAWAALAVFTFVASDASTIRSWVYLGVLGTVPPLILLRLWQGDPTQRVAALLHAPQRRS